MSVIKLIRHFSIEEKLTEFERMKKYIDIGVLVVTAAQILHELTSISYINYFIIMITVANAGLFIYGWLLMIASFKIIREVSEKNTEAFVSFHNSFFLSMIIPMVFLFDGTNTNFTNTRISDPEILKRVTVISMLVTLGIYRILPIIAGKLEKKIIKATEENAERVKRRCRKTMGYYIMLVFLTDVIVMALLSLFYFGMIYDNEAISLCVIAIAMMICLNIVMWPRFVRKRKVFASLLAILSVLFAVLGVYNVYLYENVTPYDIQPANYHKAFKYDSGGKTDLYCSFDENMMKYYIVYTSAEGNIEYKGSYECEYKAVGATKGIFRWYDIEGPIYFPKSFFEEGEQPVIIEVENESLEMSDGKSYKEYLDNENYSYTGENGNERELVVFGKDYIRFRKYILKKTDALPSDF